MRDMTPLCYLAEKHKTDKGGRHHHAGEICHEYTPVYWDLLHERRLDVKNVLEIGVNTGASLRMWEEFFPNAWIIGLDNRPETLFSAGKIHCVLADQSSAQSLQDAVNGCIFDLIVDDGSHLPEHQALSLRVLLPSLSSTGIYIVEDLHRSGDPLNLLKPVLAGFIARILKCERGLGPEHYASHLLEVRRG